MISPIMGEKPQGSEMMKDGMSVDKGRAQNCREAKLFPLVLQRGPLGTMPLY